MLKKTLYDTARDVKSKFIEIDSKFSQTNPPPVQQQQKQRQSNHSSHYETPKKTVIPEPPTHVVSVDDDADLDYGEGGGDDDFKDNNQYFQQQHQQQHQMKHSSSLNLHVGLPNSNLGYSNKPSSSSSYINQFQTSSTQKQPNPKNADLSNTYISNSFARNPVNIEPITGKRQKHTSNTLQRKQEMDDAPRITKRN